jgi:hypothetical protein
MIYVVPKGIDLGGIITSSENLVAAAKELGVDVTFFYLSPTFNSQKQRPAPDENYTYSEATDMWVHPVKGWKGAHVIDLENSYSVGEFIDECNSADLVVWGALYGLNNSTYEKHPQYIKQMFDYLTSKQVAFVRDDHMFKRHPWAREIAPHIDLWACVQQISYDSIPPDYPKVIVSSGHDLSTKNIVPWSDKLDQICMIQTFKPWKKAEELVRQVPRLARGWRIVLGGDGIARRYMASKDKCPDKFKNSDGVPIWETALASGMVWNPSMSKTQRDFCLEDSKFLVDMSEKSTGGQINRIVIEAMLKGAVPLCKHSFVEGTGMKAWVNYVPVQEKTLVDTILNFEEPVFTEIQQNNEEYVKQHDRLDTIKTLLGVCDESARA